MIAASEPITKDEEPIALNSYIEKILKNYFVSLGDQTPKNLYEVFMAEVEAPLLKFVLEQTKGNQCHAAELLGINRGTLRKKMALYQLKHNKRK